MKKRLIAFILLSVMVFSLVAPTHAFALEGEIISNAKVVQDINIGDYINFGSLFGNDIAWQVIGKENGKFLLFSAHTLFNGQYDASLSKHLTNNVTTYYRYGSNSWRYSDIRTFLNSESTTVEYPNEIFDYSNLWHGIVSQDYGENTAPNYASIPGFLNSQNFSDEELNILCPTTHVSLIDYTDPLADDSIIFPTVSSMFDTWDRVKLNYHLFQTAESTDRVFLLSAGQIQRYLVEQNLEFNSEYVGNCAYYWLRDCIAYSESQYRAYHGICSLAINGSSLSSADADSSGGIRPACWIKPAANQELEGTGTKADPYVLSWNSSSAGVNVISRVPEDLLLEQPFNISITFDHEIESVDMSGSSGRLLIVTKDSSENLSTVYELSETASIKVDGNTLIIDISQVSWEPSKEYSILLDYGVITFKDTTARIGYSYGQWAFKTPPIYLAIKSENVWNFSNYKGYFAVNGEENADGYYITSNDYNRLLSQLSNSEQKRISRNLGKSNYNINGQSNNYWSWGGSCYGMSVWVSLASQGIRSATDINSQYKNLYRAHAPLNDSNVASAINFYQQQQRLSGMVERRDVFMSMNQETQLRELQRVAEEANTTGKFGVVCIGWKETNFFSKEALHAIVVYGYEDGQNWTVKANGIVKEYTKRALIYDCSYPYSDTFDDYCIYFDENTWCIPGYNILSNSNTLSTSSLNNGRLHLVTNNLNIINAIDFITGSISSMASSTSGSNVLLGLSADSAFKVCGEDNFCIVEDGEIIESSFDEQLNIIFDIAVPVGEIDGTSQIATLALHSPGSAYTISTQDPICYDIKYGNYYMAAASDAAGSVEFLPDGSVRFKGDTVANYTLQLVADDGYHTLPWYDIVIDGNHASNVSAGWATDGLKISGDNLNNITIKASNDSETVELELDTSYTDVIVKNNNGALGAYVDTDHDGNYETPVDKGQQPETHTVTFVANNGSPNTTITTEDGMMVSRPVSPTKDGYTFIGWYTDADCTNLYDFTQPVTGDLTLYAGWKETVVLPVPGHAISVVTDGNGTATVDPKRAEAGETVTITATPDSGYEVDNITVTSVTGETIVVSDNRFTMPNCSIKVEVTFRKAMVFNPFVDVKVGDWFFEEVLWAYENDVMDGIGGSKFAPNSSVTRAMVWTVLARMDGQVISGSNWMEQACAWAIAEDVSDGTMATGNVTREQLATMLYRYLGSPAVPGNLTGYPDTDKVSDWSADAMVWATQNRIINGMNGKLNPQDGATRAQLAAMLMRFGDLSK